MDMRILEDIAFLQGCNAMYRTAIPNVFKLKCRVIDAENDFESTTMNRMHELQNKAGNAESKYYDERQKSIVNQQTTGQLVIRYMSIIDRYT
jgi:hypothetical protein